MAKKQRYKAEENPIQEAPQPYATPYHAPVLWKPIREQLIQEPDGIYIDGTLGGGGHSAVLLDGLGENARVIGVDQDDEALAEAQRRLGHDPRFQTIKGNFGDLSALLDEAEIHNVSGILLDLGVSSHQLDARELGFSFQGDGLLDMRMGADTATSASDLINYADAATLQHMLFSYGEEPKARKIVAAILESRPLTTTGELAQVIRNVIRGPEQNKALARVFQAIRIAVNAELEQLERVLPAAQHRLKAGGRLAVMSYHSLEDRRVKRFLRYGNFEGEAKKDFYGNPLTPWKLLTTKAIEADAAEIAANPRARSAKLRIAEKRAAETP